MDTKKFTRFALVPMVALGLCGAPQTASAGSHSGIAGLIAGVVVGGIAVAAATSAPAETTVVVAPPPPPPE